LELKSRFSTKTLQAEQHADAPDQGYEGARLGNRNDHVVADASAVSIALVGYEKGEAAGRGDK
jgi:hypothetical protein